MLSESISISLPGLWTQVKALELGTRFCASGNKILLCFRPVDPSLFLHRFAARMGFGQKMHQVANTALRLVQSMKRDWLQTGRRPAGICGAALYIAGHIHGTVPNFLCFSFVSTILNFLFSLIAFAFFSIL